MSASTLSTALAMSNLSHLLGVIFQDESSHITKALTNEGIDDVIDLINLPTVDFKDLEYDSTQGTMKLSRKEIRLLTNIQSWSTHLYNSSTLDDWRTLTKDDYEDFRRVEASNRVMPDVTTSSTVQTTSKTVPATSSTSSFLSNVKLDLKSFPTFDGKKEHWLKFKRGVMSIAFTHALNDIFSYEYQVPEEHDPHFPTYQAKNTFVYSIWVGRILDGYPLSIIREHEPTRDGRAVYIDMVTYFESKNNLEQLSLLTFNRLTDLVYTYKYPGGLPKFLQRFRDLIMDLQDSGREMDPSMVKSLFLSKIQDKEYKHLIDAYINDPNQDFELCAQHFLDKWERLSAAA